MQLPRGMYIKPSELFELEEMIIFDPRHENEPLNGQPLLTNGSWMLFGESLYRSKPDGDLAGFYEVLEAAFLSAGVVGIQGPWMEDRAGAIIEEKEFRAKWTGRKLMNPLDQVKDKALFELDPAKNSKLSFFEKEDREGPSKFQSATSITIRPPSSGARTKNGLAMKKSKLVYDGQAAIKLQFKWVYWLVRAGCRLWMGKSNEGFDPVILTGQSGDQIIGLVMPLMPE